MPLKAARTENAKKVLEFIFGAFDMLGKKGEGLSDREKEVRRYVLKQFPNLGRAPKVREIGEALRISEEEVIDVLKKLDSLDVIYLKPETNEIEGAYPFINSSEHRVRFKDGSITNAMCAVDALGISFMFHVPAEVKSPCSYCGLDIEVQVEGGKIAEHSPEGAVVWIGKKCASHAATSVCTTISFFCSEEHAAKWRSEQGEEGWVLSLGEALFVGKSIFSNGLE